MERTDLDRRKTNEYVFAAANRRIETAAGWYDVEPVPFICECGAMNCTEILLLPLDAYRHVRSTEGFALLPGHDDPEVEHVTEDHGDYIVVEKFRSHDT